MGNSMSFWLLERRDLVDRNRLQCEAVVVRAPDEETARRVAAEAAYEEGADAWESPRRATCVPVLTEAVAEVILQSLVEP